MCLVVRECLHAVSTDKRTTFLTSPHPQLSGNIYIVCVSGIYASGGLKPLINENFHWRRYTAVEGNDGFGDT